MNRSLCFLAFFFLVLIPFGFVYAQMISEHLDLTDTTQVHILETRRGDRFVGKVLGIENTELTFLFNQRIRLTFQLSEISRILVKDLDQETRPGEDFGEELPLEELVFSPTAFNYRAGHGAYRNLDLIWNSADVGLTDHVSAGVGLLLPVVIAVRAKATFCISDYINWGFGQNSFLEVVEGNGLTHIYTAGSLGTPEKFLNFTVGYGIHWQDSEIRPFVVTGGGAFSFASNWRVVVDVLYYRSDLENGVAPSIVLNWFKKKNQVDFGFFITPYIDLPPVVPIVSYRRRY